MEEPEVEVGGATPKRRTIKKFAFRGVDLDQLLDMGTDELVCFSFRDACFRQMFQISGLKRKPMALIKKVRMAGQLIAFNPIEEDSLKEEDESGNRSTESLEASEYSAIPYGVVFECFRGDDFEDILVKNCDFDPNSVNLMDFGDDPICASACFGPSPFAQFSSSIAVDKEDVEDGMEGIKYNQEGTLFHDSKKWSWVRGKPTRFTPISEGCLSILDRDTWIMKLFGAEDYLDAVVDYLRIRQEKSCSGKRFELRDTGDRVRIHLCHLGWTKAHWNIPKKKGALADAHSPLADAPSLMVVEHGYNPEAVMELSCGGELSASDLKAYQANSQKCLGEKSKGLLIPGNYALATVCTEVEEDVLLLPNRLSTKNCTEISGLSQSRECAFDSGMFEWTQRQCSPELCSTLVKNKGMKVNGGASKHFMAFGGCLRFCVGTDFTKVQMAVFLYCLLIEYRWTAVKGGDIVRTPSLSFPNGFHVQILKKNICSKIKIERSRDSRTMAFVLHFVETLEKVLVPLHPTDCIASSWPDLISGSRDPKDRYYVEETNGSVAPKGAKHGGIVRDLM
ncbi:hypothetical protein IFM89_035974 [Coptis chinensis]|uniref:Uncharacterized protein n=1 Tax=Coptis chinensis TaxID=261450 RepID=A0A835LHJ1_9MAGN|nr:hypothetical protein IFM89_035974 [Coptis chinensis]